jgi:hypothetical protein
VIRLSALVLVAGSLTACQTMQSWLKPASCNCAAASSARTCSAHPGGSASALETSEDATGTALERARAEAQLASDPDSAHDGDPSLRMLDRKKTEPAKNPLELFDPTVADARVAAGDEIENAFGISLDTDDEATIFTGNFSRQPGQELIVVEAGKEILAYGTDSRIARIDFAGVPAPEAFAELGLNVDPSGVRAVKLVRDDTLQLLMHWRAKTEEGKFAYKVGLFKVIGPFFAQVFTRTLATSDTENGALKRIGTYEILRGESHPFIRWIPADDAGQLLTDQAVLLKWNHWEGMYRVPRRPAAAPKREKLHAAASMAVFGNHPG